MMLNLQFGVCFQLLFLKLLDWPVLLNFHSVFFILYISKAVLFENKSTFCKV